MSPDSRSSSTLISPVIGPGISIIVVSFNVREYLDACLQSLENARAHFTEGFEVIVFDNDSYDGTVSLLKPRYPKVTFVASDRNLGFGSGCNRGAALARYPVLLFLNPDTLIGENTLQAMWNFFQSHPDIGVAGCKILNVDGSLQLACKRSFPSPWVAVWRLVGLSRIFPKSRLFGRYNLTYLDENQTHEVDAVSGSFLCVYRDLFFKIRGFDEDFFMYGEDLDLCFRIKLLGKRNYYYPGTSIKHFKGESAATRPFRSFFNFYEAMVIFSKKHLELRTLPLTLFYIGIVVMALANFVSKRFVKWQRWFLDLLFVNGIMALINFSYARYLNQSNYSVSNLDITLLWHLLVSLSVLGSLAYIGDYARIPRRTRHVFFTLTFAFLLFFSLSFFFRETAYSRVVFGSTGLLGLWVLSGWRFVVQHTSRLMPRLLGSTRRVAVLGLGPRAKNLAIHLQNDFYPGYEFVGFISGTEENIDMDSREGIIGEMDGLENLVQRLEIQDIIIALDSHGFEIALQVLAVRGKQGSNLQGAEVKLLVGEAGSKSSTWVDINLPK